MTGVPTLDGNVLSKKARRIVADAKRQGGLCYWCKRKMILPGDPGYYRIKGAVSRQGATLDHLYSFHHPLRGDPQGKHRNVIACDKCNRKRGALEMLVLARYGKLQPRVYHPNELGHQCVRP